METIITTEKISKRYKDVLAVSELSLNVRRGEIYGFLGLNGAGKTTTIRMLLGMIRPAKGKAFISGKKVSPGNHELWKDIGYLVEIPYSYPNLTVRENLEIIRRLRFISDESAVDRIIDQLKLNAYANRKARNLSLGNAQRLGLAKALIHNPAILILDEPSNGLDPAGIFEIREFLQDLAANHDVTIFISSHILGEISRFATRIGIIHEGQLIQEIDTAELEKLRQKRLLINGSDQDQISSLLKQKGYSVIKGDGGTLECKDEKAVNNPEDVATMLVHANCPPNLLKVEEEDLESYFLRTIGMKRT